MFSCIVFCYVSKSFERVWHNGLLFKLRQNGIDGKLFEWLNSYLSQSNQVCFKSCYSGLKVSKGAKISNRYNQVPHLSQDTNGKVTNSQTRDKRSALSQQVTAGHIQTDAQKGITSTRHKNMKDPQKKYSLGTVSKEGLNWFDGAPTSPLVQL